MDLRKLVREKKYELDAADQKWRDMERDYTEAREKWEKEVNQLLEFYSKLLAEGADLHLNHTVDAYLYAHQSNDDRRRQMLKSQREIDEYNVKERAVVERIQQLLKQAPVRVLHQQGSGVQL